jgi:hypothetical protein
MAALRLPRRHRLSAAAAGGLLLLGACAPRPPAHPVTAAAAPPPGPARDCIVLVGLSPRIAPGCDRVARQELKGVVSKALLDSGRYRIIATEVVLPFEPAPLEARRLAAAAGAESVALVLLHHFEVRTRVHHVHRYHDAGATGELALIDVETAELEKVARQTVHLSVRARYASSEYARDLLLRRLAEKLARELLD